MVSNKYKQLYECRLPAQAVRFHHDPASEPDSQGYTGPDIPELLGPMHDAQCLVKVGRLRHTYTALDYSCDNIYFTHTHTRTQFLMQKSIWCKIQVV